MDDSQFCQFEIDPYFLRNIDVTIELAIMYMCNQITTICNQYRIVDHTYISDLFASINHQVINDSSYKNHCIHLMLKQHRSEWKLKHHSMFTGYFSWFQDGVDVQENVIPVVFTFNRLKRDSQITLNDIKF